MIYILNNGNRIIADAEFIAQNYPDAVMEEPEPEILPRIRRFSKLGFIGLLGDDFVNILNAAKVDVQVELFVRMLDWATPDADGTSVDLDDPRVVGALHYFESEGLMGIGRAAEVLS